MSALGTYPGGPLQQLCIPFYGCSSFIDLARDLGTNSGPNFEICFGNEAWISHFVGLFSGPSVSRYLESNSGHLGLLKLCCLLEGIAKNKLSQKSFFVISVFFGCLGSSLSNFCCPGDRLEDWWISREVIQSTLAAVNPHNFRPLQHYRQRWDRWVLKREWLGQMIADEQTVS